MATPKWLELKVSVGNIISILTITFGLVAGYYAIVGQVSANSAELTRQDRRLIAVEAKMERFFDQLQVDRISLTTTLTELKTDMKYLRQSVDQISAERGP